MIIKGPRKERVIKDLKKIFRTNPNGLLPARAIRNVMRTYNEGEIYNGLKVLANKRYINKSTIRHQSYYWLRHRERGD